MIVKKKSEETERKRTYTKRVLELLYPEEHASSASIVDERGGRGSGTATEVQSDVTSTGVTSISTVKVTEKVQLSQKMYGVSSPPADHQQSASEGNLQNQTSDVQHSSSEDQESLNDDLSSTRRRRRHKKRRKTSHHDTPTTSSTEAQPRSTVTDSKSAATAEAIEPMSKNRKRKLKKKLKQADRKPVPSSEFVYKDIHETRIEKTVEH